VNSTRHAKACATCLRLVFLAFAFTVSSLAQQLEIVSARYGGENTWLDVTARVQSRVQNNALALQVDVATLGSDPLPGVVKTLRIHYRFNNREFDAAGSDNDTIRIPESSGGGRFSISDLAPSRVAPSSPPPAAPGPSTASLRIFYARYGTVDVRERLRPFLKNDRLTMPVLSQALGGPPGQTLDVIYEFRGRTLEKVVLEGQTLSLP
jgi:hypothetical protein